MLIAGDPTASALVRAGRRLADLMQDARWTVAHVERPNRPSRDPATGRRVAEALKLAEQLGAASVVLTGDDLPETVLAYARRNNITQIVMGKSPDKLWRIVAGRSLARALLQRSGGAALHFVGGGAPDTDNRMATPPPPRFSLLRDWPGYAWGLGMVVVANGLAFFLDRYSTGADLAMIFLASILITGLVFGLRAAVAASALAILTYNFFFLEPRFSLQIGHAADVFTFAIFLAVAAVTGWLTGRVRDQARLSSQRAAAVTALLAASRRLSGANTQEDAAQVLAEQASAAAGGRTLVLLPNDEELVPAAGAPGIVTLNAGAMAAARWAWEKGEAAGAGTGTLPQVGWTFWPLVGVRGRAGVAGVEVHESRGPTRNGWSRPCWTRGPWPSSGPSWPPPRWRTQPCAVRTSCARRC